MNPLCIYHGGCFDGFASAWVVWNNYGGEVELYPGVYQNEPPDVRDRDVIIVDFSYKRPVMAKMMLDCKSMLLIDHHKSAIEDLDGLFPDHNPKLRAIFGQDNSGCVMTWDYFNMHKNIDMPPMLTHIEDRDLWRFRYPETRAIIANLASYPMDIKTWADIILNSRSVEWLWEFAQGGEGILRKHMLDCHKAIDLTGRTIKWWVGATDCYDIPIVNVPYHMASDSANILCQDSLFAAAYWLGKDGIGFSLRSADDGLDVSQVAKHFGGGGHEHAAGFRVDYGSEFAVQLMKGT